MQPIIIEDNISIAAGATNNNVIVSNSSLRRYLRAPFRAQGKLIAAQSAAGLIIDLDIGSKNVVASSNPEVVSEIADPLQLINDQWGAEEGDQLVLKAANPTGGALSLRYRIILFPVDELAPDARVMQQGPIALAAGAVDTQLLDGLRYERSPVDAYLTAWMTASAAGVTRQIFVDVDSIAPPSAVNPGNRIPRDPFDLTVEGIEAPADKLLSLSASNPTGGALNVFWRTRLTETVRT